MEKIRRENLLIHEALKRINFQGPDPIIRGKADEEDFTENEPETDLIAFALQEYSQTLELNHRTTVAHILPCLSDNFLDTLNHTDPEAPYIINALNYVCSPNFTKKLNTDYKDKPYLNVTIAHKMPLMDELLSRLRAPKFTQLFCMTHAWREHRKLSDNPLEVLKCHFELYYKKKQLSVDQVNEFVERWDPMMLDFFDQCAHHLGTNVLNVPLITCSSLGLVLEAEVNSSKKKSIIKDITINDYTFKISNVVRNPKLFKKEIRLPVEEKYLYTLITDIKSHFRSISTKAFEELIIKSRSKAEILDIVIVDDNNPEWRFQEQVSANLRDKIYIKEPLTKTICSKTQKVMDHVVYIYPYGTYYRWKCCGRQTKIHPF
jgi:hypothetical protein